MGIIIAVVFLSSDSKEMKRGEVEKKAISYGMHYEEQCKVIFK